MFTVTLQLINPRLSLVFERCRQYGVSLNPDKCIFYVPSGVILDYIICQGGKFPDPKKIEALVNIPPPKNVKAIQTFNGLAQFNRCFIKDYASIMEPITRLTRKGEVLTGLPSAKVLINISRLGTRMLPSLLESTGNWSFTSIPMHLTSRLEPCWPKTPPVK